MIVTDLFRPLIVNEATAASGFENPTTGRPYLPSELRAKREQEIADEISKAQQAAAAARLLAQQAAAAATPAAAEVPAKKRGASRVPKKVTTTVPSLTSTPATVEPMAATTPAATPVASNPEPEAIGGQKINPSDPLYNKIMQNMPAGSSTAANPPPYLAATEKIAIKTIADKAVNMLRTAQSKDDLAKVKAYIDREFAKQGNKYMSEAMFFHRDRLMEQAVQIYHRRIS